MPQPVLEESRAGYAHDGDEQMHNGLRRHGWHTEGAQMRGDRDGRLWHDAGWGSRPSKVEDMVDWTAGGKTSCSALSSPTTA